MERSIHRGEALVALDSESAIETALACDHKYIGKRWVGVKRETDDAVQRFFYGAYPFANNARRRAAAKCQTTTENDKADEFRAIALTGLPFSSTEAELAKFASGFNVDKHAGRPAVIVPDSKSAKRSSGEGMVLLTRPADAAAATAALHKKELGRRPVTVRPAMQREFEAAVAAAGPPQAAAAAAVGGGPGGNPRGFTCIHAKGLPYQVGRTEFQQWLMDNRIGGIADGGEAVIVAVSRDGRRSRGDAYIRFVSPVAVEDATRVSGARLGGRYIELIPCSLGEAQAEVNMPAHDINNAPAHAPQGHHPADHGVPPPQVAAHAPPPQASPFAMADRAVPEVPPTYPGIIALRGLGSKARPEDVLQACEQAGRRAYLNDVFIIASVNNGCTGDVYIRFRNCTGEEAAQTAAALNTIPILGRTVQAVAAFQGDLNQALQRPPDFQGPAPESAMRLRGMPWQADEREICEWFTCVEGVPAPAQVHIIPDPRQGGRPSGDVMVRFMDAARAEAALCRNKAHMRGRYVELFRCSEEEFVKLTDPSRPPPDFAHLPGGKFYHPTRTDMDAPPRGGGPRGGPPRGGGYGHGDRRGPPRDGGRYQGGGPPPHHGGGAPPMHHAPVNGGGGGGGDWAAEWGNGAAQAPPPAWGAGPADQAPPPAW